MKTSQEATASTFLRSRKSPKNVIIRHSELKFLYPKTGQLLNFFLLQMHFFICARAQSDCQMVKPLGSATKPGGFWLKREWLSRLEKKVEAVILVQRQNKYCVGDFLLFLFVFRVFRFFKFFILIFIFDRFLDRYRTLLRT